jgi:hypothetical protein
MKMTEFRSTQPLNDDDLAAIRANVMASIAVRRGLLLFMRFAIAAAIVIAIGLTFIGRRQTQTPLVATKPNATRPTRETSVAPTASPVVNEEPVLRSAPTPQPIAHAVYRPKRRPPQNSDYQIIRLEFRTPDPDVRIIWIASQNPTTPTGGKS